MELIYGTYNQAKYDSMKKMIIDLEIELINLSSLKENLIESDESWNDPLSNAEEKAKNYYRQLKRPVFPAILDCILKVLKNQNNLV